MPWLTGTALLHSVMVQERRGMLKTWTISLVLCTGILAVLGTFLVRSEILQSIHAFGASTLGAPFLVFIAALSIGSVALVSHRRGGRCRDRWPGAAPGRRRAPVADAGGAAPRTAGRRYAQPPPLRRLHRPRWHGGDFRRSRSVFGVPAHLPGPAHARPQRHCR